MTLITPLLLLIVLIPFFFLVASRGIEMSEAQRQTCQKFLIISAVTFVPLYLLLLLIARLGPGGTFFVSILPVPFTIALLCYLRWKYPRKPRDISTVTLVIVFGILFTCMILIGACGYYVQIYYRNQTEQIRQSILPPAVPPPVDYSLPHITPTHPDE